MALQNKEKWHFPFWNIFVNLEISMFLDYAVWENDDVIRFATKMANYWMKNVSKNVEAVFLKTWHQ